MTNPTSTASPASGMEHSENSSTGASTDAMREFEDKLPSKAIRLELEAIEKILLALLPLSHEQSKRALQYAIDFFHLNEEKKHPLDSACRPSR